MICEGFQAVPPPAAMDSGKLPWHLQKELRCQWGNQITCGMLPTLRVLASKGCNSQGFCLVPLNPEMDSASHLQMTLLEAYCREVGIEVVRVTEDALRTAVGKEEQDLSCVLVTTDDNSYFLETPE
ncbi:uncharacterized protein LOC107272521 [Cephus cinctus]|uniref:Uncharacterized protein LOC107272521 n=1 Tax=Cephus cinctus TaxID=211228 RepID=A0AAJ7CAT2_CEPCN|nr:uncharacterized protein LOC107272521 [Cephus cinctus]